MHKLNICINLRSKKSPVKLKKTLHECFQNGFSAQDVRKILDINKSCSYTYVSMSQMVMPNLSLVIKGRKTRKEQHKMMES